MITCHKLINKPIQFKRFTGISPEQFMVLVDGLQPAWNNAEKTRLNSVNPKRKRKIGAGHPYRLKATEDKLLLLLMYYRAYLTYDLIGFLFDLHPANVYRLIVKLSPLVGKVADPKLNQLTKLKKPRRIGTLQELIETFPELTEIIIDATEQQVNKPKGKRRKNPYRSGKKKQHTIKTQMTINKQGQILHISTATPGGVHDKTLLLRSKVIDHLPTKTKQFLDRGYEGLLKSYPDHDIRLPFKRYWKQGPTLSRGKKLANKLRSKRRIKVEHVFGKLKQFQILSQRYRTSLKLYHQHFTNLAAIYNFKNNYAKVT